MPRPNLLYHLLKSPKRQLPRMLESMDLLPLLLLSPRHQYQTSEHDAESESLLDMIKRQAQKLGMSSPVKDEVEATPGDKPQVIGSPKEDTLGRDWAEAPSLRL